MKEILKMKFKAHRLVNYLFYIIIFFVGFFIGFGAKNLNIKNIISQLMFIDNVEARTIATVNGTPIDEDYVYSRFKEKWENFDINIYNKISCGWFNNTTKSLHCVALTTNAFNNKTFVAKDSNVTYNGTNVFRVRYSIPNNKTDAYEFMYETSTNTYTSSKLYDSSTVSDSNLNYFSFYFNNWQSGVSAASNFSVSEVSSSEDSYFNAFDFSKYIEYTITENNNNIEYTYTYDYSDLKDLPTSTNWSQEDYIYNLFNTVNNKFDLKLKFKDFSYVFAVASGNSYSFYFSKNEFYMTDYYHLYVNNDYLYINIDKDDQDIYLSYTQNKVNNYANILFSNGIKSDKFATTSASMDNSRIVKRLDFTDKTLEFNKNLFKDNENFKQVCVYENKPFTITTTDTEGIYDFIWFLGDLKGLYKYEYTNQESSDNSTNLLKYNDEIAQEHYYFKDFITINNYYSDSVIANYFNHTGYTDKYAYYGYSAYRFTFLYDSETKNILMPIFEFKNPKLEGSFGSLFEFDTIKIDTELKQKKYCFYIKNKYTVSEINTNEFGDYVIDSVPTPGGDYSGETTYNKDKVQENASGFINYINNFISKIKPTIDFINNQILNLYNSMPSIVRLFIISVFVIFIIVLILRMVIK